MKTNLIKSIIIVGISIGLNGCIGSSETRDQREKTTDRYYNLPETPPAFKLNRPVLKGVLGIDRLDANALRNDTHILLSYAKTPLEIIKHHYHYWSAPPTELVQQRIYNYLGQANFATKVVRYDAAREVDYVLRGRIVKFERLVYESGAAKDEVLVSLELDISKNNGKIVIARKRYDIRLKHGRGDFQKTIIAFDEAVRKILDLFIKDNKPKSTKIIKLASEVENISQCS